MFSKVLALKWSDHLWTEVKVVLLSHYRHPGNAAPATTTPRPIPYPFTDTGFFLFTINLDDRGGYSSIGITIIHCCGITAMVSGEYA